MQLEPRRVQRSNYLNGCGIISTLGLALGLFGGLVGGIIAFGGSQCENPAEDCAANRKAGLALFIAAAVTIPSLPLLSLSSLPNMVKWITSEIG